MKTTASLRTELQRCEQRVRVLETKLSIAERSRSEHSENSSMKDLVMAQNQTLSLELNHARAGVERLQQSLRTGSGGSGRSNQTESSALKVETEHQLKMAQERCNRLEQQLREMEHNDVTVAELRAQLAQWQQAVSNIPNINGPLNLGAWINHIVEEKAFTVDQLNQALLEAQQLQAEVDRLNVKSMKSDRENSTLQRRFAELESQLQTTEVHLRNRTEECSRLEKLFQVAGVSGTSESRDTELLSKLERVEAQCQALEQSLRIKSKALLDESACVSQLKTECEETELKLTRSKEMVQNLNKQIEALEAEVARLENAIDSGSHFNPKRTKVLHMAVNPEFENFNNDKSDKNELKQEIASLKEYNKELLLQIGKLSRQAEQGTSQSQMVLENENADSVGSSASVPVALARDLQNAQTALTTAREELDVERKKNQRLVEVFKTKIHQFREACFQLTGFRIDMIDKQYRLTSMYSEHSNDYFLFQVDGGGSLEMLETPICAHWTQEIDTFLVTCKSIPAFMSHFTLQMFQKRTFMP
eukprot:c10173_g1_i1.p1 GENE.c10173_g1_i1~~c10173_g1_i1.p1  ORF type:complete len:533 (+),score=150.38 c10173_g1_i1:2-1600(+)